MSTETKPRGICPECGQERQLTKSGHMRYHRGRPTERWYRAADCDGVGMLPKSVVADPVAAALDLGRAAGWREAIEALRGSGDQLLDHQRDGIHPCPCGRVRLGGSHTAHLAAVLADFLESLAPKETP